MESYKGFVAYFIIKFRITDNHLILKAVLSMSKIATKWRMKERNINTAIHSWANVKAQSIRISINILISTTKR